ncbi:MAG TPA: hypothetical protein VMT15_11665 [Bryobacteraceae bacterium]|nr:hypothetical protein [Bryobacteraceae bacterium]
MLAFVPLALAQSVIVGTRAADGKIVFETAEDFQINQSRRIHLLPEQREDVDPNAIRRLTRIDLAQAGVIRNDGTSRVVSLNGPNEPRDIVLPDNYSLRGSTPAKDVPGRLVLTVVHNRRARQTENVAPEAFVVALFGVSPDEAVRDFLDKDWAFLNVDEQLAAMRGFAASFPGSPALKEFRDSLESRITRALNALEEGGSYGDFVPTRRFSEVARQIFPGDASLAALDARVAGRIQFITERQRLIRSLAALGDWDTLLDKYQDFERYEGSFPEMQAADEEALTESARAHSLRARGFEQRADYTKALNEAAAALARDPANREIRKLVSDEKMLASQVEALANASRRKILPKGLPADLRFGNALSNADRAIADKDFKKAQEFIQDSDRENPGAPEVILMRAKLIAAQGRHAEAIPLLDQYDRRATASAERERGYELRRQVVYELDKNQDALRAQVAGLLKEGLYSQANEVLRGLTVDKEDPVLLYQSGVAAAVLGEKDRASTALNEFLAHGNTIGVNPAQRLRARRILAILRGEKASASRRTEGLIYDPQSLMFLIPLESVSANHVRMTFNWANGRLDSIRTAFEDDRGAQLYRALVVAGAADSGALAASAGADQGNFFFEYHPNGALREVLARIPPTLPAKPYNVHVSRDDKGHVFLIDDEQHPEVVLPDHPFVDPAVLAVAEGAPVTTVVAGNSFFNPFLWDGVHMFTVRYDREGRAESAEEWNADNTVRFRWDGLHLASIHAYHKGSETPYYQRTITYAGPNLSEEDLSVNGRAGRIRYTYANGRLQQIRIEQDGREWTARPR